jgi:hypothetical protein
MTRDSVTVTAARFLTVNASRMPRRRVTPRERSRRTVRAAQEGPGVSLMLPSRAPQRCGGEKSSNLLAMMSRCDSRALLLERARPPPTLLQNS